MSDFEDLLSVKPLSENRFDITVKLPDFLGLLSVITGLFASNGIEVLRGRITTQDKKAYDRFEVAVKEIADWKKIEADLKKISEQALKNDFATVRSEMNQRIIQYLRKIKLKKGAQLAPIALSIHQDFSPNETVVDIYAQDTPAFLYELTNALSMLGINIAKMEIETVGNKVRDRIWVTTDTGEKINSEEKLKALQWAILLVKQYTHLLAYVPDPAQALDQIARFGRDILTRQDFSEVLLSLKRSKNLEQLSKIFGTTRFLWEEFIRTQHESVFPILANEKILRIKKSRAQMARESGLFLRNKKSLDEKITALNEYKDREMFRIDLRHILGKASYLGEFAEEFTDLAEVVVETAYGLAYEATCSKLTPPLVSSPNVSVGDPRSMDPRLKSCGDDRRVASECVIFGLGKFGGRELGYASDLEVMFVYSDHADSASEQSRLNLEFYSELVRQFKKVIHTRGEGVFEIDLKLRPHGNKGPLAVSFHAFKEYYRDGGGAWDFERQALIKLRSISGSESFSQEIFHLRDEYVFSERPYDFAEALKLRDRQRKELVKAGTFNAKYSEGGLIDLEYLVQTLQLFWGRKCAGDVRNPNTLKALRALWEIGVLPEKTFQAIRASYIFIRSVINALRIVRGNAKDLTLPPKNSEELIMLARRIGYAGENEEVGKKFSSRIERYTDIAKTLYASYLKELTAIQSDSRGGETLPVRQAGPPLQPEWRRLQPPAETLRISLDNLLRGDFSLEDRRVMSQLGFRHVEEAARKLGRICPNVLAFEPFALALDRAWPIWPEVPDPDLALIHLEAFIEKLENPDTFWEFVAESQEGLRILLKLFGSSKYLSEILIENPDYWAWLLKPEDIRLERTKAMLEHFSLSFPRKRESMDSMDPRGSPSTPLGMVSLSNHGDDINDLRHLRHKETLRIALAEMITREPLEEVYRMYSLLADFILENLLSLNGIQEKICVLSLGKLGGQELNFSSDLDLMCLHEETSDPSDLAKKIQTLLNSLKEGGPNEFLYRVDLRLRPHGDNGALAMNEKDTLHYYQKEGDAWELQAMIKARAAAGIKNLGKSFIEKISPQVYSTELDSGFLERIREIKRRYEQMTRERGEEDINVKMGKGGIRDIEFTVQMIQMREGFRHPELKTPNTFEALRQIKTLGLLKEGEVLALKEGYELMRRIENRVQLYENRQVFNLPSEKTKLRILAKSLGFRDSEDLIAEEKFEAVYSKTKLVCRAIFEREFYNRL